MTRAQHLLLVGFLFVGFAVLWRLSPGSPLPDLPALVAAGWRAPLRVLEATPAWAWWAVFGVAMSLRCGKRRGAWNRCGAMASCRQSS